MKYSAFIKSALIAPLAGPPAGLAVTILYSQKLPDIGYVWAFLGLGIILAYSVMLVVGVPIFLALIRCKRLTVTYVVLASIIFTILFVGSILGRKDVPISVWLFDACVVGFAVISCSIFFLYIFRKLSH